MCNVFDALRSIQSFWDLLEIMHEAGENAHAIGSQPSAFYTFAKICNL